MTINDVADLAKVSPATVSRVINNSGYYSEEAGKKVSEAIKKLDYKPSKLAQNLRNGKSGIIAIMYPFSMSDELKEIIEAVNHEAAKNNQTVALYKTRYNVKKEKEILRLLDENAFDALIISSCKISYSYISAYNKKNNIISCEKVNNSYVSNVSINFKGMANELLPFIINKSKTFGIITGLRHSHNSYFNIMQNTYNKVKKYKKDTCFLTGCKDYNHAYLLGKELLLKENVPDLIWTDSCAIGAGVKKSFMDHGYKDFKIISLNSLPLGNFADLMLVDIKLKDFGKALFNLIGLKPQSIILDYEILFPLI